MLRVTVKKKTHISAIKLYKDLEKKAVKDALQSGAQRF